MLLSAVSRRCVLHALRTSSCGVSTGARAASYSSSSSCGVSTRARAAGSGLLSIPQSLQWQVPGLLSRCLSSSGQTSSGQSSLGELVYTGSLASAVRGVKLFSLSTSGAAVLLMPHILLNSSLPSESLVVQVCYCIIIGFFTFITPAALHFICKGYVVRLYHEPEQDTYTAVTYSLILREKKTVFHQEKVRLPEVSKMFTTFYAGKTGLLVNPDLFTSPHHYNHLMGYDKPFDFKFGEKDES